MLLHLLLSFAQVEEKGAPEKPFNRPALPLSIQYYSSTGRSVYYLAFMAIGFPRISTQRLALERPSIEARVQSVLRSPRHSRVLMALLPHTYIYICYIQCLATQDKSPKSNRTSSFNRVSRKPRFQCSGHLLCTQNGHSKTRREKRHRKTHSRTAVSAAPTYTHLSSLSSTAYTSAFLLRTTPAPHSTLARRPLRSFIYCYSKAAIDRHAIRAG